MVSKSMPNCREAEHHSAKTKNLSGTAQPCKHPCWNDIRPLQEKSHDSLGWPSDQWAGKSIRQWWPRSSSAVPNCCSVNVTGIKRNMDDVLWSGFHVPWRFVALTFEPWCRDDYGKESRNDKIPRPSRQLHQQFWRRSTIRCILTSQSSVLPYFKHDRQNKFSNQ